MVLDVYSRKIVGHEVNIAGVGGNGLAADAQTSLAGLAGRGGAASDNGSSMKGSTMLATLEKLGIMPSFSRPRVSNDNAYAESLFRTCKYRPNYPSKPFESIEKARQWTLSFVQWYNRKHSGLKFVTPAQRHDRDGRSSSTANRSGPPKQRIRRWTGLHGIEELNDEVWLNPERKPPEELRKAA